VHAHDSIPIECVLRVVGRQLYTFPSGIAEIIVGKQAWWLRYLLVRTTQASHLDATVAGIK